MNRDDGADMDKNADLRLSHAERVGTDALSARPALILSVPSAEDLPSWPL